MPTRTGRFRRADRILKSREFERVVESGARRASQTFVVFVVLGCRRGRRLGITVSRKVGNAVVRNRVKRRVREWFRVTRDRLPGGAEVVVIARRPVRDLDSGATHDELDRLLVGLEVAAGTSELAPC